MTDVVDGGIFAGDRVGLVICGRGRGDKTDPGGDGRKCGDQGQGLELVDLAHVPQRFRIVGTLAHGSAVGKEDEMDLRRLGPQCQPAPEVEVERCVARRRWVAPAGGVRPVGGHAQSER